jgi:hypothetical protein
VVSVVLKVEVAADSGRMRTIQALGILTDVSVQQCANGNSLLRKNTRCEEASHAYAVFVYRTPDRQEK